jgi:hypothetical protein
MLLAMLLMMLRRKKNCSWTTAYGRDLLITGFTDTNEIRESEEGPARHQT